MGDEYPRAIRGFGLIRVVATEQPRLVSVARIWTLNGAAFRGHETRRRDGRGC